MAHRHLRHVQRLCDATLEPALPLQTQCLETTPLPPILQRAFRGFHAYLMPISKIKLHCATISRCFPMAAAPTSPTLLLSRFRYVSAVRCSAMATAPASPMLFSEMLSCVSALRCSPMATAPASPMLFPAKLSPVSPLRTLSSLITERMFPAQILQRARSSDPLFESNDSILWFFRLLRR